MIKALLGSVVVATLTSVYVAAESAQTIIDSETAVSGAVVINVALVFAAVFVVFKAGGIFRDWATAVASAKEVADAITRINDTQNQMEARLEAHEERMAGLDREILALRNTLDTIEVRWGLRRDLAEGDD